MPASKQDDYLKDLERMANQIAANFERLPADQAARAVADHLKRFWDPSMRRDLLQALSGDAVVVSDAVREALKSAH